MNSKQGQGLNGLSGSTAQVPARRRSRVPQFLAIVVVALFVVSAFAVLGVRPEAGSHVASRIVPSVGPEYLVTFTEKGLPPATNWTGVLAGTHHIQSNNSFSVSEGNGAYVWSVLSIDAPMAGNVAGWAPNQTGGVLHVLNGPAYINITFLHGFNVTIHESGLPVGTQWQLTLNGTNRTSVNSLMTYILPNASYSFQVENPLPGPTGVRYIPAASTYAITVKGSNISKTDTFTTQFFLDTIASPANGGTVTPASEWVNNQSSVTFTATPASGYQFVNWRGNGTGSFSNTNPSQMITVVGPITEIASFAAHYSVTFTETGLPTGKTWSVTLNGSLLSSATSTITFQEKNGTFSYTVGTLSGYNATPASGSVPVSGASANVTIAWSPYGYAVKYTESGLPSGTNWSVTVNSVLKSSVTSTIFFSEPNGTYNYTVGTISGYGATPSFGSVTVASGPRSIAINWTQGKYLVTFVESGLPSGTNWTAIVSGSAKSSVGTSIAFMEANGTFSFSILGVTGYSASPASGSVTVNGADVTKPITWTVTTYTVTFDETGLLGTTIWAVTLGGSLQSNVSTPIIFHEPAGAYNFSVQTITGYSANPATGSLLVIATAVSQTIVFSKLFSVTLTETGLPANTDWSVALNGQIGAANTSVTPNQISFQEPNGSYSLVVLGVAGYHVGSYSSVVTVSGVAVVVPLTYSAATFTVTFTESGLPSGTNWSVTFAGSQLTSGSTTITFTASNGTFNFTVGSVPNYGATPASGSLRVAGGNLNEAIQFSSSSGSSSSILGLSLIDFALVVGIIILAAVLLAALFLQRRRASEKKE